MVYVLLGTIDYAGDTLLGVYTTQDQATQAYEQYCVEHSVFDSFQIHQVEVGAAAEHRW